MAALKGEKLLDDSVYELNERKANWSCACALLILIAITAVVWVLNLLSVIEIDGRRMNIVFFSMLPTTSAPYILMRFFKLRKKWLKNFVLGCVIIISCYIYTFLTYYVVLIMIFPVLLSCHYYSRRITINTALFTALGCVLSTSFGVYFGAIDANTAFLPAGTQLTVNGSVGDAIRASGALDYYTTLIHTFRYGFLPRLWIFLSLTFICIAIASRTKSLLKHQMLATQENERIGAELGIATHIQVSMLPKILPTFPGREEFDVFATMHPAKEVGGDFYDCFFVDNNHFAFVIADVSGKGVPAALFMVIAKTLVKNHLQAGLAPAEALAETNRQLCEGNDENMFVTAWAGLYEISTGKLAYANAGHNPPLLKRAGGEYDYIHDKPELILAVADEAVFHTKELQLGVGDSIYLYTDGVTEATNEQNKLFGEARLKETLNQNLNETVKSICENVKASVDEFVAEAPQFDDITMLSIEIKAVAEH